MPSLTDQWGPDMWAIIHTIAKSYPKNPNIKDKTVAHQLTKYLALVLPCPNCQKHYIQNYTKYKPDLSSGPGFFKWTVKIHNLVNKSNNKKQIDNVTAYKITKNKINSGSLSKLLKYLVKESNYNNVNKMALQKFIDCLTYLSNYYPGSWSLGENTDISTVSHNKDRPIDRDNNRSKSSRSSNNGNGNSNSNSNSNNQNQNQNQNQNNSHNLIGMNYNNNHNKLRGFGKRRRRGF